MDFNKLKEASSKSEEKTTSKKDFKAKVVDILSRFPTEEASIKECFDKLILDTARTFQPSGNQGYRFRCVFEENPMVKDSWDKTIMKSGAFIYNLEGNELTRSCKYSTIYVGYDDNQKYGLDIISNTIPCPDPATITLTDEDANILRGNRTDDDWFKSQDGVLRGYDLGEMADTLEDKLRDLTKDPKIIACKTEYYTRYHGLDGYIVTFDIYPEGNQNGLRYLAKEELDDVVTYDKCREFETKYREMVLEDIRNADFNAPMEDILCKEMERNDLSNKRLLTGKFHFIYTSPICKLEAQQPNVVMTASEGTYLEYESKNYYANVVDFGKKDVISLEMSDTFWACKDVRFVLNDQYLSISSDEMFYDTCYTPDLDDFYDKALKIISEKITEIGLTITHCDWVTYEDNDNRDIRIEFENPVYVDKTESATA